MESNILFERIPFIISVLIILFLVIRDSIKIYGKNKTLAFFIFGIIYSILRANFIGFIMHLKHDIPPSLPYEVAFPLFKIFNTTPVEIAGWLIVSYLSLRFSSYILKDSSFFHQIVLSSLFIASCSFAIETTAIEGDWWRWNVILGDSIFGRVPTIGIIDWAFASFDFLFPFCLFFFIKSNIFLKIFSLLIFPFHMLIHLSSGVISEGFPTTLVNLFHIFIPFLLLLFAIANKNLKVLGDNATGAINNSKNYKISVPIICTIIIVLNLIFYNLYFIIFKNKGLNEENFKIELFISLLPLLFFLVFNYKFLKIIFFIISIILSFYFKEAIPSFILFFSIYFIIFEKNIKIVPLKILYISIPFIILLFLSLKDGNKVIKVNKAIEDFNSAYKNGLWEEAKENLEKSLSLEPRHPVGNFMMAEYYLKKENNKEKAKYYYKRSLVFYKYYKESLIQLIQLLLEENNLKNAQDLFEHGFPFFKDDPSINYLGFRIYKIKGEENRAREFLVKVNKLTSIENMGKLHLYTILNLKSEKEAEKVAWDCLSQKKNISECSMFLWEFYFARNDTGKLKELQDFMENLK